MSLTGMGGGTCGVKLTCEDMNIENCAAGMKDCGDNFNPEVQIEHNRNSVRFTCTESYCYTVSPTICAPETTTTTVVNSIPYCETTSTTTPSPVTGNSPTMCTPATVVSTVVNSVPYCETTHTTHGCETTTITGKSHSTSSLIITQYLLIPCTPP